MNAYGVREMPCPACAAPIGEAVSYGINTVGPKEGDLTICSECSAFSVFVGNPVSSLRYPTDEEEKRFLKSRKVREFAQVIKRAREGCP